MYKPDKLRVEDALLPAVMLCIMQLKDGDTPLEESPFANVYPILRAVVDKNITNRKLLRRLQKVTEVCMQYFGDNKFKTSKSFITVTIWGLILYRKRAVEAERGSEFYIIWRDFYYTVRDDGMDYIEGFQKLYDSAVSHIDKIHKAVTKEGYFV